jgi:hypothetical protein
MVIKLSGNLGIILHTSRDSLSEHIVSAADDLYHMRIPQIWCQMAGSAAPPLTMSVAAWLNGDKDRDGLSSFRGDVKNIKFTDAK